jgi:hypothetical protein
MTDVRLTALNPVDSQVYPVACNTSGELIVEQVAPGPDLTVTGNLTVNGNSTVDGDSTVDGSITVVGDITAGGLPYNGTLGAQMQSAGVLLAARSGTLPIFTGYQVGSTTETSIISASGNATFVGEVQSGGDPNNGVNVGCKLYGSQGTVAVTTGNPAIAVWAGFSQGTSTPTSLITGAGFATFAGDITCSDNTKGLILKSPNGTSYRLSVANDGTLSTSVA